MKNSKASKQLKDHFSEKKNDKISENFKTTQNWLQKKMELPANIKLSGFTFQDMDEPNPLMGCTKMCTQWIPPINPGEKGHYHVYCCKP